MQPQELGNVTNIARGTDINWIQINQHCHTKTSFIIFLQRRFQLRNEKIERTWRTSQLLYNDMKKRLKPTSEIRWAISVGICLIIVCVLFSTYFFWSEHLFCNERTGWCCPRGGRCSWRPPPGPASTSYEVTNQEHVPGIQENNILISLQIFTTSAVCSFMFHLYLWIEV